MKTVTGFTLIELMITVAIVGILAAIAYPSYVNHVQRARRADAEATLMELAQLVERNYMVTLPPRYDSDSSGNLINDAYLLQQWLQGRTVLNYYNFAIVFNYDNTVAIGFTLSASPAGPQADDECGKLTLGNTGTKGPGECW